MEIDILTYQMPVLKGRQVMKVKNEKTAYNPIRALG